MKLTKPLILASNSPRRRQILSEAGFQFEVQVKPTDEAFPATMSATEVPVFLAEQKVKLKAFFPEYLKLERFLIVLC